MRKTMMIDNSNAQLTKLMVELEKKGWKLEKISNIPQTTKINVVFYKKDDKDEERDFPRVK